MSEKIEPAVYVSPLAAWPGEFSLPALEEFSGVQWNDFRRAFSAANDDSTQRQFGYAGLDLIEKHGKWQMDIPLATVRAWQKKPQDERMLLISWLGLCMSDYIGRLTAPKG